MYFIKFQNGQPPVYRFIAWIKKAFIELSQIVRDKDKLSKHHKK